MVLRLGRYASLVLFAAMAATAAQSQSELRPQSSTNFDKAVDLLARELRTDRAYEPWSRNLMCLSFMSEEETKTYVDIGVHESHRDHPDICPGDPATYPIVDRFRVFPRSKQILWLDPVEGQYKSYDVFLQSRKPSR